MNPRPDPADKLTPSTWVLRRLRKAGLVLLLLLTAFYQIENWRGARAWKIAQARLAAAGESLDLKALEPPRIAPEENFCSTPALDGIGGEGDAAEIKRRRLAKLSLEPHARSGRNFIPILTREPLDWLAWRRQLEATKHLKPPAEESDPVRAVVRAFEPHAALFDELEQAARDRPQARFDPPLYQISNRCGVISLLHGPSPIEVLESGLELKARACLAAGKPEQAAKLLAVFWRLRLASTNEPCRSVSQLATLSRHQAATHVLLDGLRLRSWSEQNLVEAQRQLSALDLHQQSLRSNRWELADATDFIDRLIADRSSALVEWSPYYSQGLNSPLEWILRLSPRGWLRQHQAFATNELLDRRISPLRDSGLLAWHQSELKRRIDREEGRRPPQIYSAMLATSLYPKFTPLRLLFADTDTRLLRAACALERHFLRHQGYPDDLQALQPDFLAEIPRDLNGQPLRYARDETSGRYRLWSVGVNLVDDWHGQPPPRPVDGRPTRHSPHDALDWVVSFPPLAP